MNDLFTLHESSLTRLLNARPAVRKTTAEGASLPPVPTAPVWPEEEAALRGRFWEQIGELELRLRALIEDRCQTQYGDDWITSIPTEMREAWSRLQTRDERAFAQYDAPPRSFLNYSIISELKDLIARQWALFYDVYGAEIANTYSRSAPRQ